MSSHDQKLKIKKDDLVKVISGNDKGKEGKILVVFPEKNKVIIEGVNIIKKHTRPKSQTEQGGIVSKEAPVDISKIMLICPSCHLPTRIGFKPDPKNKRNKKRICRKCGAAISNR